MFMESVRMQEKNDHICFCPLEGVIDVISKKWALLVVNAIGNYGKLRFNNLMQELGNISPKTLSDMLKELQAEGLIKRESFAEIPPRVEYSLTRDGAELRKAIIPLLKWAATRSAWNKEKCASTYKAIPAHQVKNLTWSTRTIGEIAVGQESRMPLRNTGRSMPSLEGKGKNARRNKKTTQGSS